MKNDTDKIRHDELYHIHNDIVDWSLTACSVLGIIAQTFATLRMLYIGFSYIIIFQNLVIITLIIITVNRKRMKLPIKAAFILFLIYIIFISSFVKFGFLASSKVYLVIVPIFSIFTIGYKKTFILILFSLALYFLVGFLFVRGILIYGYDVKKYIINTNSWLMDGSIIMITAIAAMIIFNKYSTALISKISDLEIRNKAVSDNENKYRALFENANDGILIMKNNIFVDCNQSILSMFQIDQNDLTGKSTTDFSPEFQPDGMKSIEKSITYIRKALNDQPQQFEWLHKRKNGELFYTEVSLNKLNLNDEIFVQAVLRDISEKKQVERKILNAIVQAEEREREKFAKELHDGLGPLFSTIKLYTQSAQDEKNHKARESELDIIHDSINEAISSLKEISNNISPHILHNFGLTAAINNFLDNIRLTKKVNISCSSNTKERFQDIIEFTVYRVLVELINNAVKEAQVKHISINIEQKGNTLHVTYLDDGKGTDLIPIADKQTGMFNIQNRIKALNGQIEIDEKNGTGLKVNMLINLDEIESLNS